MPSTDAYPARLTVDYPEKLDRLTTFIRLIMAIPILVILGLIAGSGGMSLATMLMIVFRQRYPRWWFEFIRELARFGGRVGCYLCLLTDRYPSTVDEQSFHLEIDYPDAEADLNRWLPLIKWLLAIPHFVMLALLAIGVIIAVLLAWMAILITGSYPRPLFDYVVGVFRWGTRVLAYAVWLVTDHYPPFSLTSVVTSPGTSR